LANVRGLELSQQYGGECDKRQDTQGHDNERSFRIGVQLFIIHSRQRWGRGVFQKIPRLRWGGVETEMIHGNNLLRGTGPGTVTTEDLERWQRTSAH
jgi:hypothetical protein